MASHATANLAHLKRWKASPTSGRSLFRLQATEAPEVVAE